VPVKGSCVDSRPTA